MEGIRKAKAAGRYKGRPTTLDAGEIARLKAEGLGASAIAKRLNIARSSVYRVTGEVQCAEPPRGRSDGRKAFLSFGGAATLCCS